jgi:predicted nucleic acid-binding protein
VAGVLFVDSSGWIALLSARDRRHPDVERAMREALGARTRLLTTNLILAEVHRWLLFRAGPLAARIALERIERSAALEVVFATRDDHTAAHAWLGRFADQRISYTHAASFAVMHARRCERALTLDGDFVVAGFRRVP